VKTLRVLIAEANLKQVFISEQTGIPENRISQLVTERRIPNLEEAEKLAVVLGCSIKEIYSANEKA
jgi:transcriptional regulator with XRE-family HTH domain